MMTISAISTPPRAISTPPRAQVVVHNNLGDLLQVMTMNAISSPTHVTGGCAQQLGGSVEGSGPGGPASSPAVLQRVPAH